MSLFSSLNLARLSLTAHQAAIQTVGQNIANANTEGYARQRVEMQPTPAMDLGYARIGTGVAVARIERIVDEHLEATLREARSQLGDFQERNRIYSMLESVFNDLDGSGLSEALGNFFEAMEDLANQPEDPTTRFMFLEEADTLASTFRHLDAKVRDLRAGLDEEIVGGFQEVNRLITVIASLNKSIVLAEDGGVHPGTANDLRTQRDSLLGRLSELVDIKVIENSRGAVQVITGSDVLVFESRANTLEISSETDGDITRHLARFTLDGARFRPEGGRLAALLEGRDGIVPERRAELDTLAAGFLQELNAIHSTGEGLARQTAVRSAFQFGPLDVPLSEAGLPFPVKHGSFSFQVVNEGDGTRETYVVPIDLDGFGNDDTTLQDVLDFFNTQVAADHPEISASVTTDGFLEITSSSPSLSFTFRDDRSGFLVASGINTLFAGTNAREIEVSGWLRQDPAQVATGRGAGIGDNTAVLEMLALRDSAFLGPGNMTIEGYYTSIVGRIGVGGAEARGFLQSQEAITNNLSNQREALSGVSIDEEAIQLIRYQRAYQGSARFLNVVDRLLETLINSV